MELATAKRIVKRINGPDSDGKIIARLYEDYSGRGMFGAKTTGVVLPGYHITEQMRKKYRLDNMGLDMIIY